MYFESIKRGWKARLALLGISPKKFCEANDISYESWKRLKNPTIATCEDIENKLAKLEK